MKAFLMRLFRRISLGLSFTVFIGLFLLIILWDRMVFTTPVGHTSIVWHRLFWSGERTSRGPLAEGLHIILPWDLFFTYDLRLQYHKEKYQVVSKDGLHFDVEVAFRWRAVPQNIRILNQNIGPDYLNKLLVPEVGSVTREVVANYTAEALYTEARSDVQHAIYEEVTKDALPNGIGHRDRQSKNHQDVVILKDVLVKRVELPKHIQQAIERKLEQDQVAQEYRFRVEREKLESERKRIEAEGIRVFQETVTPAISESYLRWRGIEATLKLSQSPNSKVVVIGNSATGLPLILDTADRLPSNANEIAKPSLQAEDENSSLDDYSRNDQTSVEEFDRQDTQPEDITPTKPTGN
jgi:regulator of protease activity HflC (stomatin/prohibitin superfamily)